MYQTYELATLRTLKTFTNTGVNKQKTHKTNPLTVHTRTKVDAHILSLNIDNNCDIKSKNPLTTHTWTKFDAHIMLLNIDDNYDIKSEKKTLWTIEKL